MIPLRKSSDSSSESTDLSECNDSSSKSNEPSISHEIPGQSNELVATSPDEHVKEEECEEPPLPKKSKKNKNAKANKTVISNCCEISTACEKINAVPEPRKRKKRGTRLFQMT